jgi:uncharacterized protein (TIGR03437 family)
MSKISVALAVVCSTAAWAAAPAYTAAQIVNISNYVAGPFAPSSLVAIFGSELSRGPQLLGAGDIVAQLLPRELNYTRVYINDTPAPLLYVSPGQINFLMPSTINPGQAKVRVVREGFTGPEIVVTVVAAAPALFDLATGYAVATHLDGSLIATTSPAHGGEVIVLYATGMGKTSPNPGYAEIPQYPAPIEDVAGLRITLDGTPVETSRILYVGLTPTAAGLYQVNLALPDNTPSDPEIRVRIGDQASAAGLKIAVR